ncbi:NmrA family NAD(P)-binding protein [Streptomyces sp. NPDC002730]|uniref:NmrA family NAD(P)-binding protein n=1 Tax=Streptomyces sp. NPDC002730 TaxID=3364662 RepID=UPI0036CACE06
MLDNGWPVRTLVRDPDKQGAKDLKALGAELVTGDLDDPESLCAAAQGVHGVFSVQPADLADPHPEEEVRQGKNVADAAKAADVAHLIYSSVGGAERKSGVAHFETKAEIEAHIDAISAPATVLRPVFFMENWPYMVPEAENGERVGLIALEADTSLQMIALVDIGRIAADAFDKAGRVHRQEDRDRRRRADRAADRRGVHQGRRHTDSHRAAVDRGDRGGVTGSGSPLTRPSSPSG